MPPRHPTPSRLVDEGVAIAAWAANPCLSARLYASPTSSAFLSGISFIRAWKAKAMKRARAAA